MKGSLSITSSPGSPLNDVGGASRKAARPSRRAATARSTLPLLCLLTLLSLPLAAQDSPQEKAEPEEADILAMEQRKLDLFRRSSESHLKRAGYPQYLEENIAQLRRIFPLNKSQSEKIEKLSERVLGELIELGIPAIEAQFARYSEAYQKTRLSDERSALRIISVSSIPDLPDPMEMEAWKAGLAEILGKKKYEQWEGAHLRLRKAKEEEELGLLKETFEFREERDELYYETFLAKRTARVFADLSLPDDRRKKIEATAKKFTEDMLRSIREEAIEAFEKASPLERQRLLKTAGSQSIISQRPESESEEAWIEVLNPLLSPEELEILAECDERRKEENIRTVGLNAFFTMDRFLRFDEEQEAGVVSVFAERVRERVSTGTLAHCPPLRLSNLVSDFKQEEHRELLRPHLTPGQNERLDTFLDTFTYSGFTIDFDSEPDSLEDDELTEEVRLDMLVGSYMIQRLDWERSRRILPLRSQIEEMNRAGLLKASDRSRLEIAAKGAVTREVEPFNDQLPDHVRAQVERVLKSDRRDQPLRIIINLQADDVRAAETPLWKEAVASLLGPKEMETWRAIEVGRIEREKEALVDLVLSETDHEFCLSEKQRTSLRPLLAEAIEEYSTDFKAIETYSRAWFESYSGSVLFCLKAIPEERREGILTKKQRDLWKTKYETRFKSAWDRIESLRKERDHPGEEKKTEEAEVEAAKEAGGVKAEIQMLPMIRKPLN